MRVVINPLTGALDFVGDDGGGGGGTVTSVAGGTGITNSPEPIIGAGTVHLDIDSLTTETTLAAGDLFAFVDVSAGGTAIANQRKVAFSNIVVGLNPLLDHGGLLGLADDDHAQYLLLAGRAGGQVAIGGTASGDDLTARSTSHTTKGHLIWDDAQKWWPSLTAIPVGTTWVAAFDHALTDDTAAATWGLLRFDPAVSAANSIQVEPDIEVLSIAGTITNSGINPNIGTFYAMRCTTNFAASSSGVAGPWIRRCFTDETVTRTTAGTVSVTDNIVNHFSAFLAPTFRADGASAFLPLTGLNGTRVSPVFQALNGGEIWGDLDATLPFDFVAHQVNNPGVTVTGGGSVNLGSVVALNVANMTAGTTNISVRSQGSGVQMRHLGPGIFGSITSSPVGIFDVYGDVTIQPSPGAGRLMLFEASASGTNRTSFQAQAQAADVDYTLPAAAPATNGESLTSTTAGLMSWAAMQPLDADLTEIAALANVRGDLLVTNSTPAWSRLAIGAADRYLKSDGTDAAWAQVTELGLVDTYNGITTVSVGMPSIVAEANATAQTANIGTTTIYTVPSDGYYRLIGYIIITTVGTVSSTMPAFVITWVDGDNATTQTATPTATSTGNLLTTRAQFLLVFWANAGSNITYATTGYAANAAASMQYSARLRLEAL